MSIRVDASEALERLDEIEKALTKSGLTKVARRGKRLARQDQVGAFFKQRDPETGEPWQPRKHEYSWSMLRRSGELIGAITSRGHALDHVAYIGSAASDGYRKDGRAHDLVARAVQYGRKRARSHKGSKLKILAGSISTTGQTPPRKFGGMSKQSARSLRRYAEKLLRK